MLDVAGTEEGAVGTAEFIFGSDLGVGGADGRGGAGTPCGGTAGESVLGGADAFTTGAGADAREGTGRDSCFGSGPRVDFAPGLAVDFGFIAGAAAGDAFAEDGGVTGLPTARETGGVAGPTDFATAFGLAAGFEIVNGALIGVDGAFTVGGTALGAPFGAIDRPAGDAGFAGSGLG